MGGLPWSVPELVCVCRHVHAGNTTRPDSTGRRQQKRLALPQTAPYTLLPRAGFTLYPFTVTSCKHDYTALSSEHPSSELSHLRRRRSPLNLQLVSEVRGACADSALCGQLRGWRLKILTTGHHWSTGERSVCSDTPEGS